MNREQLFLNNGEFFVQFCTEGYINFVPKLVGPKIDMVLLARGNLADYDFHIAQPLTSF